MATNLEVGQYYRDFVNKLFLIYEGEESGYYWFRLVDIDNRCVAYYEEELKNLRRY